MEIILHRANGSVLKEQPNNFPLSSPWSNLQCDSHISSADACANYREVLYNIPRLNREVQKNSPEHEFTPIYKLQPIMMTYFKKVTDW